MYTQYIKSKSILSSDFSPIPKISHYLWINIQKSEEKNSETFLTPNISGKNYPIIYISHYGFHCFQFSNSVIQIQTIEYEMCQAVEYFQVHHLANRYLKAFCLPDKRAIHNKPFSTAAVYSFKNMYDFILCV